MKKQNVKSPRLFSDEDFSELILNSKEFLNAEQIRDRLELISNSDVLNESKIKELIQLGWFYEKSIPLDTNSRKLIHEKIDSYKFEYSPDCKSSFLYRLHFYLAIKDQNKSQEIINQIYEKATSRNGKIHWEYRTSSGDKYINWGLSHGVAGIVSFILHGVENDILDYSKNIEAINKISKSILDDSRLKQTLSDYNKDTANCFLTFGYCYGALPTLFILYRIAKLNFDKDLKMFCETQIQQLSYFEPKQGHFDHHYLCHGYAGVALTFFTGYRHLKHEYLTEAYQKWINYTKETLKKNSTKTLTPLDNELDSSLLFGKPGIQLTIATLSGSIQTPWYSLLGY